MSVLFAVLAMISGIIGTFLAGFIGLGITFVFAGLAILFAARKKKTVGKVGVGSIITSVIAICFSGLILLGIVAVGNYLRDEARKCDAPLVEKYMGDFKFGVIGVAAKISNDGVDEVEFRRQLDKVTDVTTEDNSKSTSTDDETTTE
ncbi:MAG: hypothetical protein K5865_09845 [Eubacterium sp.]|nr:hypothetical protein [Eubacterium sp.]